MARRERPSDEEVPLPVPPPELVGMPFVEDWVSEADIAEYLRSGDPRNGRGWGAVMACRRRSREARDGWLRAHAPELMFQRRRDRAGDDLPERDRRAVHDALLGTGHGIPRWRVDPAARWRRIVAESAGGDVPPGG